MFENSVHPKHGVQKIPTMSHHSSPPPPKLNPSEMCHPTLSRIYRYLLCSWYSVLFPIKHSPNSSNLWIKIHDKNVKIKMYMTLPKFHQSWKFKPSWMNWFRWCKSVNHVIHKLFRILYLMTDVREIFRSHPRTLLWMEEKVMYNKCCQKGIRKCVISDSK